MHGLKATVKLRTAKMTTYNFNNYRVVIEDISSSTDE
jgi:hypothetical protein